MVTIPNFTRFWHFKGVTYVSHLLQPVRVELDLAVVEVGVGSFVKLAIGIRIIAARPSRSPDFEIYFPIKAGLYPLNPVFYSATSAHKTKSAPDKQQAVSPQHNTLLETVISKTLVVFSLLKREFGDSNP